MIQFIVNIEDTGGGNCAISFQPNIINATDPEIAVATGVKQRLNKLVESIATEPDVTLTMNTKKFHKKY